MLAKDFEDFIDSIQVDNQEDIDAKFKAITKRLNMSFWDSNSESEHSYKVGSLGRQTAIKGVSDMDMLFVLPDEVYKQYNNYQGNGQSALLQTVKAEIKKRYTHESTIVRGDGQVVVVSFSNYEVEVCPAFLESDGSYTYPDSNNGGKWRGTDPMPEIDASESMIENTNQHFKYVCQLVRAWRNHVGFKMGGLLVDTLVNNFFEKYPSYQTVDFEDYLPLLKDLFGYLKGLDKDQKYWYALGSNQKVYNKGGSFVTKAEKAYNKLKDLAEDSENLYQALQELFGKKFPAPAPVQKSEKVVFAMSSYTDKEQFIVDLFSLDIRYSLNIDCEVKQNGFRETLLRTLLRQGKPLLVNKQLTFFIDRNEVADRGLPYEVYWKVRNRGDEAIRKNQLRGEILKGGKEKIERTSFRGAHYVECYIIHNGVCVARDSIDVPISIAPIYAR